GQGGSDAREEKKPARHDHDRTAAHLLIEEPDTVLCRHVPFFNLYGPAGRFGLRRDKRHTCGQDRQRQYSKHWISSSAPVRPAAVLSETPRLALAGDACNPRGLQCFSTRKSLTRERLAR